MDIFLATLFFFLLATLGLSVGFLVTGKRLKGSCGGLPAAMAKGEAVPDFCPVCQKPTIDLEGDCGKKSSK